MVLLERSVPGNCSILISILKPIGGKIWEGAQRQRLPGRMIILLFSIGGKICEGVQPPSVHNYTLANVRSPSLSIIAVITITITIIIHTIIITTVTQPVLANPRNMQNMRAALPRASVEYGDHSSRNHNWTDLSGRGSSRMPQRCKKPINQLSRD